MIALQPLGQDYCENYVATVCSSDHNHFPLALFGCINMPEVNQKCYLTFNCTEWEYFLSKEMWI